MDMCKYCGKEFEYGTGYGIHICTFTCLQEHTMKKQCECGAEMVFSDPSKTRLVCPACKPTNWTRSMIGPAVRTRTFRDVWGNPRL